MATGIGRSVSGAIPPPRASCSVTRRDSPQNLRFAENVSGAALDNREDTPMKLSVIGCGYLGAVHAASMAELGHEVIGIDVDTEKINLLRDGRARSLSPGHPKF